MADSKSNTIARERVDNLASRNGEPAWLKESRVSSWESLIFKRRCRQLKMKTGAKLKLNR